MNSLYLQEIMNLIMYSGDAKSNAMEAIQLAKKGNFDQVNEKLKEAHTSLIEAHHTQTELLTKEAQGKDLNITLLAMHSQDHLMTSIIFTELATEIVELHQKMMRD